MRSKGETLLMVYWLVATCMSVSQDITGIEASGWDCMVLNAAGASDWRFKNRRGSPVKNSLSLNGVSMIRGYRIFNWSFNASDSLSARRRCSTSVVVGQFWFSSKSSGFVCLFVCLVLWLFDSGGTVVCRLPVVIEWCWEKPIFFDRLYKSESVVYSGSFPKVLDVPFLKNIFSLLVKVEFHTFQSIFSRSVSVSQIEKLFPHSFLEKNCGRFRGITYLMCRTETYLTLLKELKSKVARVNDPRGQISYTKEGKKESESTTPLSYSSCFQLPCRPEFFQALISPMPK